MSFLSNETKSHFDSDAKSDLTPWIFYAIIA